MNARTIVLIFAVVLIGVGFIMMVGDLFGDDPPPRTVVVARANQQIEPSTVISQDLISTEEMRVSDASDLNAWRYDQVAGMMAAGLISAGDLLTAGNAQPIADYRLDTDLDEELVSFAASVDRLVAGQLKPGQLINIYGINKGQPEETFTALIEPNVRVVRVTQSSGRSAGQGTPQADLETGGLTYSDDKLVAGTMLTVALPPERAFNLIDALGARGLDPWVTIAANTTVDAMAMATPGGAQAQPTVELPDIGATMTAIWESLATEQPAPPVTGGGGANQ